MHEFSAALLLELRALVVVATAGEALVAARHPAHLFAALAALVLVRLPSPAAVVLLLLHVTTIILSHENLSFSIRLDVTMGDHAGRLGAQSMGGARPRATRTAYTRPHAYSRPCLIDCAQQPPLGISLVATAPRRISAASNPTSPGKWRQE
ncbi:hypothetical protein [Nannocystis pusilla]|uniref:hypothetical protein n=1 Tax=Nannocystis pusilla TaxID=889268 RepID=UPI003B80E665